MLEKPGASTQQKPGHRHSEHCRRRARPRRRTGRSRHCRCEAGTAGHCRWRATARTGASTARARGRPRPQRTRRGPPGPAPHCPLKGRPLRGRWRQAGPVVGTQMAKAQTPDATLHANTRWRHCDVCAKPPMSNLKISVFNTQHNFHVSRKWPLRPTVQAWAEATSSTSLTNVTCSTAGGSIQRTSTACSTASAPGPGLSGKVELGGPPPHPPPIGFPGFPVSPACPH